MNKLFTKIVGAALGLTMAIGVGVAVGNSREATPVHAADDVVITFPSSPSKYTNSYTSSFTQTHSSIVFTFAGWNNGVKAADNWTSIRGGQKKNAWSGTVSSGKFSSSVASVDVTITQLAACNGSKLEVSTQSDFSTIAQTITKNASDMSASKLTYTVTTPTANCYYRLTFNQTASANGSIRMSRIAFNYAAAKTLSSISLSGTYPTSFYTGDTFSHSGMTVTANYSDSTSADVTNSATFSGYNMSTAGNQTVTVSYNEGGTGDKYVEYSISVSDKTYAAQVTSVSDLWDGQQIYFGASDGSKVNVAHAGVNQLGSQTANVHKTKGLCVDDLEHKTPYTVHREKIDGVTYYSFQNGGYYLEASNTSNNYLTRTDTLSDNCKYTISISNGEVTMTNKGNSSRPEFRWNSGSSWFSQYQSGSSLDKTVIYAVTTYLKEAVADSFAENWLHMSDYTSSQGWCADEEHAYYSKLKPVWAAMDEYEKAALSPEAYARLTAWAAANGDTLDSDMNLVVASRISILGITVQNSNTVAIIVIISMISVTAIGGYFFIRKRREQ